MSAFLCSQAEALLTVPERLFLNASIPARTQSRCAPASGSGTDPTHGLPCCLVPAAVPIPQGAPR